MKRSNVAAAALMLAMLAGSALAQPLTGTLKIIMDAGAISLGVRDSSIPFSYLDDKQSYQGYSIELCMKAVSAIQKQLGMSSLNDKMVPMTTETRIPLISYGTIDLSCKTDTKKQKQQKQKTKAPTMFIT